MRFVFITGAEGSGTTLLRRLVSAPDGCAANAQNFVSGPPSARAAVGRLTLAAARLWDAANSLPAQRAARSEWNDAISLLQNAPETQAVTHVILKRSTPFALDDGLAWPDLWDTLDLGSDRRTIVVYRDPCAATYSNLRRGFDSDLRRLAVRTSDALTRLAAQVRAVPAGVCIVRYRDMYESTVPSLRAVARYCGLPPEPMIDAAQAEGIHADPDRRYRDELSPHDAAWLEAYFHEGRRRQWDVLENGNVEKTSA